MSGLGPELIVEVGSWGQIPIHKSGPELGVKVGSQFRSWVQRWVSDSGPYSKVEFLIGCRSWVLVQKLGHGSGVGVWSQIRYRYCISDPSSRSCVMVESWFESRIPNLMPESDLIWKSGLRLGVRIRGRVPDWVSRSSLKSKVGSRVRCRSRIIIRKSGLNLSIKSWLESQVGVGSLVRCQDRVLN